MSFDDIYARVWDVKIKEMGGAYVSSHISHGNCIGPDLDALIGQQGYREIIPGNGYGSTRTFVTPRTPGVILVSSDHFSLLVGGEGVLMEAPQIADAIKGWNRKIFEGKQPSAASNPPG